MALKLEDMAEQAVRRPGGAAEHRSRGRARDSIAVWSGPSGCGKTTFLRMVAGLEPAKPRARSCSTVRSSAGQAANRGFEVFQNDSRLPWRTVLANAPPSDR